MAYSENQLTTQWMPQIRFPNGANVNLMAVRNAIQEQCEENGIPFSFADAQLKVGGLFSKELKISSSCAILSTSLTIFVLQSASSTRANMLLCRYTIWAEARTLSMIIEPTLKHGVALEDLCSMLSVATGQNLKQSKTTTPSCTIALRMWWANSRK